MAAAPVTVHAAEEPGQAGSSAASGTESGVSTLEALQPRVGSSVEVILCDGARHDGRLASASASALVLRVGRADLVLPAEAVWRVETRRRRVSVWAGAAQGAVAGVVLPYIVGFLALQSGDDVPLWYVRIDRRAEIGAVVGFTVALLLPKEHVLLYEASAVGGGGRLQVSPLVTPHAQGAALSFSWGGR